MKRFGIGIIGCGRISKKHVEAIVYNWQDCYLEGVADILPEQLEKAVKNHQQYVEELTKKGQLPAQMLDSTTIKKYQDYQDLLKNEFIDIVAISTESGYHARIAIDAMRAGKHVIVEKPMAMSTTDAEEMIQVAKEQGVKLCVCHQNRFNPPIQRMRQALEEGRFGKLIHGVASIRWCRDENYYLQAPWRGTWALDGGTLMNQCIHDIDLLQWMMGPVERITAETGRYLRNIEGEDCGVAILRFKSGALGIIEGSACIYPKNLEETINIFGEKGTVVIGGVAVNRIETWRFLEGEAESEVLAEQAGADPDTVYGYGHTPLYADMFNAIRNDHEPLINGEEGKKVIEIVLGIYKSQRTGQPVEFPLGDYSTLTGVEE